jgi:anti-sigma factor RsiW
MSEPAAHPEELLAGYVDGSASHDERRAVEDHLAVCPTCRRDVELAASAHASLASLPELAPPGLTQRVLAVARQGTPSSLDDARERRRRRLARLGWASGMGAAAALIALFGFLITGGGGPSTASRAGGPPERLSGPVAGASTAALPAVIEQRASYTPATVNALATDLAVGLGVSITPAPRQSGIPAKSAAAPPSVAEGPLTTDASLAPAALTCLRAGGAPRPETPFYLELGSFQGTPAYIGAFRTAGGSSDVGPTNGSILVIVVSQNGCQPLYEVRERIIAP